MLAPQTFTNDRSNVFQSYFPKLGLGNKKFRVFKVIKQGKKGLAPELAEILAKSTQIKDDPALETPQRKEKLYAVLQEAVELSKKDEELYNAAQRRVNYARRKQVLRMWL